MGQTQLSAGFDAALLAGIRADLGRWRSATYRPSGVYDKSPLRDGAAHNRRLRVAKDGILEIDVAAWLGHNASGAERRAASRALATLEAAGQITRLTGPSGRTVAVRVNLAAGLEQTT